MQEYTKRAAYISIILLGIVSLMGDIVYEGARADISPYLEFLGASAIIVGLVGGLGEFVGYAIRLLSGYLADTTRAYWLFTFIGYGLIIAIPLLALSKTWQIAALLVIVERLGKALRSPSRDTILSMVSRGVGSGRAFGIHETLDQIGAIAGPLLVGFLMLYTENNYPTVFATLSIPFLIMIFALFFTYKNIGRLTEIKKEEGVRSVKREKLNRNFYLYSAAVLFNTLGLINILLITFKASQILPMEKKWIIPMIFVIIQGVDASIAYISGYTYDKLGVKFLMVPFILSIFPSLITLISKDLSMIILACVFFGVVLGMQESIYRAVIADMTPLDSRGTAYGIFNTVYGLGLLGGGVVYGLFINYGTDMVLIAAYAVLSQIVAISLLMRCKIR